jgi:alanine racemase
VTLRLTVDGDRWRAHMRRLAEATPGLVPVAKGNGYGLGLASLARRTAWLGCDTLAVGTYAELPQVASRYDGSLLVLNPWRPHVPDLDPALWDRVIHTVSRWDDVRALLARQPGARMVLERITSMRRHGMTAPELWSAAATARHHARVEGVALHLPMTGGNLAETTRLMADVIGAELGTVWVSHLTADELTRLRQEYADLVIRPRIGTALWLGDRDALRVGATVEDVHEIARGDEFGYRGRTLHRSGHLVIASGGTAHGIGLAAPSGDSGLRGRAASVARGSLEAVGMSRSPYFIDGQQLHFAEPPHMQSSMLLLPHGARVPSIGEELDVRVRYTTTTFDETTLT